MRLLLRDRRTSALPQRGHLCEPATPSDALAHDAEHAKVGVVCFSIGTATRHVPQNGRTAKRPDSMRFTNDRLGAAHFVVTPFLPDRIRKMTFGISSSKPRK